MTTDRIATRQKNLLKKIKADGLPAMLITNVTNVTYLTGFTGDSTYLLIGPKIRILISDSRYTTQLEEECPGHELYIRPHTQTLAEATSGVLEKAKLSTIGFEGTMTHLDWSNLLVELPEVKLNPYAALVEELRMVKDAGEIAETRQAVRLAEKGFASLRAQWKGGQTELQIAHELEHNVRRLGGSGLAFEAIIAAGPRSALPHARPTQQIASDAEFLLVDWGAQTPSGYKSDLTRTLWIEHDSRPGQKESKSRRAKYEKIFAVVAAAHKAAIDTIRPGVLCADADTAARKVIEDAGYGAYFGHSVGHGVGLNIHELPRLAQISKNIFEPGQIVTVEPGIYLPGWGGIRLEDDVLVTKDGHEVLSSVTRDVNELILN